MPRWLRVIRGMLGMGLVFSAGVGVVAAVVASVIWLVGGGDMELFRLAAASAIWSFPIGVAFSGFTALLARGRSFETLSLPRFALSGAGAGLALYSLLALNAWDAWSPSAAIANAVIFVLLGAGSATASLVVARKAGPALEPGDETPRVEGKVQGP